eukprot:7782656-Pyramimonas_sp.AAC.1
MGLARPPDTSFAHLTNPSISPGKSDPARVASRMTLSQSMVLSAWWRFAIAAILNIRPMRLSHLAIC